MSAPEPDAPAPLPLGLEYVYFVAFTARSPDGVPQIGNAEVILRTPITRIKHVRDAQRWLEQETDLPSVIVLSFILLRTQEMPE